MTEEAAQPTNDDQAPQLRVVLTLHANGSIGFEGLQDVGSFLMLLEMARMEVMTKVAAGRVAQEIQAQQAKKKIITPDGFGIAPKGGH